MRLNLKDIVLKSKLEMAKTLYANGVSLYYISLATGLSWRVLMTELTFMPVMKIFDKKLTLTYPSFK